MALKALAMPRSFSLKRRMSEPQKDRSVVADVERFSRRWKERIAYGRQIDR